MCFLSCLLPPSPKQPDYFGRPLILSCRSPLCRRKPGLRYTKTSHESMSASRSDHFHSFDSLLIASIVFRRFLSAHPIGLIGYIGFPCVFCALCRVGLYKYCSCSPLHGSGSLSIFISRHLTVSFYIHCLPFTPTVPSNIIHSRTLTSILTTRPPTTCLSRSYTLSSLLPVSTNIPLWSCS